ncbi:MAG: RNA methyltransferase substrate-binding domain-containing protein, partial [Candidatus Dormiibacterota bacterium]
MRERPSPRDTSITIYGRKPVLEALRDPARPVAKVIVATNAEGAIIHEITEAARRSGVKVFHAAPHRVKSLAGNGRHDQGVVADVEAPRMSTLDDYLAALPGAVDATGTAGHLLLLDGVANPANVGLILRVAAAMGIGAVILPRVGTPDVGPLVIKASAGLAFQTPILHCRTPEQAAAALHEAGRPLLGLAAAGGQPLPTAVLPD